VLKNTFERPAQVNERIGCDTKSLRERFDSLTARTWLSDYQRLNVNHARQDGEYSMKTKTEADNQALRLTLSA
jgi:hypothetical protein